MKKLSLCCALLIAAGCATAPKPQQPNVPQTLHGVASWYGQEFAGRTTANGEIFDPMLFTAAHRTLPFGTVCDVFNPKTGQSVRVRINDRGPYIGGRMIDLSYAAAQQIGLVDPGSGEVDVTVVKLGNGDREAPAPLVVTVPDVKPIPVATTTNDAAAPPPSIPVVVDNVAVVEDHHGVETRLQVAPDGRTLKEVPVQPAAPAVAAKAEPQVSSTSAKFFVQVGAFAQEANAKELQTQLAHIGQDAHIDGGRLYKVRIGPFETRDQAIAARGRLESAGMSAIVVAQ
ncbi:MAG TPA: septal ring lytic transglycosylase RlpA family protein [Thermoanaerobaculia bacterium]|nr:septal ring lytic transglycosylase RlpA family protein [Thermoanaerobaculia bacterium]